MEAMGKQGLLRLERGKEPGDQEYQTKYNGTATIEIVSPIAPYGVVTLEKLCVKETSMSHAAFIR